MSLSESPADEAVTVYFQLLDIIAGSIFFSPVDVHQTELFLSAVGFPVVIVCSNDNRL